MLFLDHFYISIDEANFKELKEFFSHFSSVGVYKVLNLESSWEGIYPFVQNGAYPKLIKVSQTEPVEEVGIALSNTKINFLHERLSTGYPEYKFEKSVNVRGDGSEYYISSTPIKASQMAKLFAIDWQGAYKNIRDNIWGKDATNPFLKVESVDLKLLPDSLKHFSEHSEWYSAKNNLGNKIIVAQYEEGFCPIHLIESLDGKQGMRYVLKVKDCSLLPSKVPGCISIDNENNTMTFEYNM